ncbi:MAG: hypothetical protein QXP38_00755 [Nitrososphaerota archaeon]
MENKQERRKFRRLVPLWAVLVIVLIVGISVYAITITVLPTSYTSLYENNIVPSPVVVSSANVVFIGPNNIEVILVVTNTAQSSLNAWVNVTLITSLSPAYYYENQTTGPITAGASVPLIYSFSEPGITAAYQNDMIEVQVIP